MTLHTAIDIGFAHSGQGIVRIIYGRRLARRLPHISVDWRALLGADLATGRMQLCRPTLRQAATLLHVSQGYVNTAARLLPAQRAAVERGELALSSIHHTPSDAEIDRIVVSYGAERVMASLDRLIAPVPAPVTTVDDNEPRGSWAEIQQHNHDRHEDAPSHG